MRAMTNPGPGAQPGGGGGKKFTMNAYQKLAKRKRQKARAKLVTQDEIKNGVANIRQIRGLEANCRR